LCHNKEIHYLLSAIAFDVVAGFPAKVRGTISKGGFAFKNCDVSVLSASSTFHLCSAHVGEHGMFRIKAQINQAVLTTETGTPF
jgi:hypothetical protein